jgi:hypothetical protein
MKFFKFDGDVAQLDREEIALYPNIKKILVRDQGGKVIGDTDGRHKKFAYKEFTYIYFMCDFAAYPAQHGLNDKEAHEYAIKHAKLPSDYKPDDVVRAVMVQYEKEHLSPAKKAIKTLIRLFTLNDRIVEKIENNLTATLELPTLNRDQIKEILEYQQKLIDIATTIPQQAKKLREAMSLLEEEEKAVQIMRGGDVKHSSMDPGNNIES